jgi:hypothetical protein
LQSNNATRTNENVKPQNRTAFERALAGAIQENPRLAAALHTSLSSTDQSTTPSESKATDSKSKSSEPFKPSDLKSLIEMRVQRAKAAANRNKEEKEGNNASSPNLGGPVGNNRSPQDKEEEKEEEEEEAVKPKGPCKSHPPSVRCFRCLTGDSGKKVKHLKGNVFGFAS